MRKHTYISCALLFIWFSFSLASGVEAHLQEKQQMPKQDANPKEAKKRARFDVILTNAGGRKIEVIKVVREVTGLSLKYAKDLVESAPKPVKKSIPKQEAESIRKKLTDVGASVEVTVVKPN